jgi:hypothetical protein
MWEYHGPIVNAFSLRIWGWWVTMLSWNQYTWPTVNKWNGDKINCLLTKFWLCPLPLDALGMCLFCLRVNPALVSGLPLAERRCESIMDLSSIHSAYGFGDGGWQCCFGINTHDLQLTSGIENGWNCHTRNMT